MRGAVVRFIYLTQRSVTKPLEKPELRKGYFVKLLVKDGWSIFEVLLSDRLALNAKVRNDAKITPSDMSAPLILACENGHLRIVEALLRHGAEPDAKGETTGSSALQVAVRRGHLAIVECLLRNGADADAIDSRGWTELHSAAYSGNLPLVECLLRCGADRNVRSKEGATPLDVAKDHSNGWSIIKVLEDATANDRAEIGGPLQDEQTSDAKPEVASDLIRKKLDHNLDRLVRRLICYQDEATFLDALREAAALSKEGDDLGVRALNEAVCRRCGKQNVTFYMPNFGGMEARTAEDYVEAEDILVELAKSNRLLEEPAATQNLISAALASLGFDGIGKLVKNIFDIAGAEQGYDFQLLFNQLHSAISLRHALGERTWTEKSRDVPQTTTFLKTIPATSGKSLSRR